MFHIGKRKGSVRGRSFDIVLRQPSAPEISCLFRVESPTLTQSFLLLFLPLPSLIHTSLTRTLSLSLCSSPADKEAGSLPLSVVHGLAASAPPGSGVDAHIPKPHPDPRNQSPFSQDPGDSQVRKFEKHRFIPEVVATEFQFTSQLQ